MVLSSSNIVIRLNPRFVGQVFRRYPFAVRTWKNSLNPRFVGQVFRHNEAQKDKPYYVLIPDLWGKSSDIYIDAKEIRRGVLIPDLWGKSSDCNLLKIPLVFNRLKDVFWIPNFLTIKNIA